MEQQTAPYPTMTALEFGMPNIHEDSHSRGALTDSPNTENASQTASHTNLAELHPGHMMQPAMHFPESHASDGSNGPLHPCEPILFFHPDDSMAQTQPAGKQGEKQLARMRNSARIQKRSALEKKCKCCGTMNTPVWRWGGDAKDTLLCNACSLRIRRSNARPQRTKSPTERPQRKQQANSTHSNSDSGGGVRQLTPEEIDALRQRLAGFMIQEKERLLGGEALDDYMWDSGSGEMEGKFKQQPYIMAPPPIYPSEVQISPYGFSREAPWNENGFAQRNPRDPYLDQLHDQELAYIPF